MAQVMVHIHRAATGPHSRIPGRNQMQHRVVIVGGGFAGVTLARALERELPDNVGIVLLSDENFLLFSPLLSEVVGASILPAHCVAPIRQLLGRTEFRRASVRAIDFERREVHFDCGGEHRLRYGELALACGVRANLALIPGMAEHAFPLKTLGDALELRNRVLLQLELAEAEADPARRRILTSFVVVGGGSSGIEVAGALHDLLAAASPLYPKVELHDCRVTVLEAMDRPLGEFPASLAAFAQRQMARRGITIRTGAKVAEVGAQALALADGERLPVGTTVCTIGAEPQQLVDRLALPKQKGFVEVGDDLAVAGQAHAWALGDCARVANGDDGPAPPTAQFAVREARHLAGNLRRRLHGEPTRPFAYRPRAILATVGHRRAVASVFGVNMHGFTAWLLWRAVYLAKLPTLLRRVQVFFEWSWEMLFPRDVSQFHYMPYRLADGTRVGAQPGEAGSAEGRAAQDHRRAAGSR
jgi:NADH dehydrogenase